MQPDQPHQNHNHLPSSNDPPLQTIPGPGIQQASAADEPKDFVMAFLLSWLLGVVGADRFYLGYTGLGIAKLLTFGGLGLWAYIDVALLSFGKMRDKRNVPLRGYESNKSWVRILAILHLLFFGLIILSLILTYVAGSVLRHRAFTN